MKLPMFETETWNELEEQEWFAKIRHMSTYWTLSNVTICYEQVTVKFSALNKVNATLFTFKKCSSVKLEIQEALHTSIRYISKNLTPEDERKLYRCWYQNIALLPEENTIEITITNGYDKHKIQIENSQEVFFEEIREARESRMLSGMI